MHICNPSYPGGGGRKIAVQMGPWGKKLEALFEKYL
jgi:hypothetical protein